MSFKGYQTHDSVDRCVLCDAPVGVISNDFKLPSYQFAEDLYCEYCGRCLCPYCGIDNVDIENGCEAVDVFGNPMHYKVEEIKHPKSAE